MTVLNHTVDLALGTADTNYPDEFSTYMVQGLGSQQLQPMFVTDRPIWIDSFSYRFSVAATDADGVTHAIGAVPNGVGNTQAGSYLKTETITGDGAGGNMLANICYTGKGLPNGGNYAPAGSMICFVQTAAIDQAAGVLTIRYRTRPA